MSSFLPLKANDDVRALTCNPVIFESALINSSLTPSLRYSSFLSALMFTNGSTAMDFWSAAFAALGATGEVGLLRGCVVDHQTMAIINRKASASAAGTSFGEVGLDSVSNLTTDGVRCSQGRTMRNKSIVTEMFFNSVGASFSKRASSALRI